MPSLTVENYLKAILQITLRSRSKQVTTGQLAEALNVSPGTVTSMLKTLAESALVTYRPYEGVTLNEAGCKLAMRMLRRHRLIELFLVQTLNLQWDQVHEEAENMEHAVSDFLIDRIDHYLGQPETDPHGDPIPSVDGVMRGHDPDAVPLTSCSPGSKVKIVRVIDQNPEFLRYLSDSGLELGAVSRVEENRPESGIVTIVVNERVIAMGHPAAEQLLVVPVPEMQVNR